MVINRNSTAGTTICLCGGNSPNYTTLLVNLDLDWEQYPAQISSLMVYPYGLCPIMYTGTNELKVIP
jgi:hypothetical protein